MKPCFFELLRWSGSVFYYTNTTITSDENNFSLEKFQQAFTQGKKFEKFKDRMTTAFDAYGRLLHHTIS